MGDKYYQYKQTTHLPRSLLRPQRNGTIHEHRWLAAMAALNFTLKYKPSAKNVDADILSHRPGAYHGLWKKAQASQQVGRRRVRCGRTAQPRCAGLQPLQRDRPHQEEPNSSLEPPATSWDGPCCRHSWRWEVDPESRQEEEDPESNATTNSPSVEPQRNAYNNNNNNNK